MKKTIAVGRRTFLAAMPAAGVVRAATRPKGVIDEYDPANLKLAHRTPWNASDDELLFLKQVGLRWVRLEYGAQDPGVDALGKVQKRFASFGIGLYGAVHDSYRSLKIQLGQPGRDQDIETYRTFLRSCGKLGIRVAPYDFHPGNTYTTSMVERRGYRARQFDLEEFRSRVEKQRFERKYSADEIWATYTYFVKAALPVAAEAGVKMALHPDDPPLAEMNGVAKLFIDYDGYRRAEQIAAGSPAWGIRLCVGTWAEGGRAMGRDVFEMIRDFGGRGKLHDVDFRNVTATLPRFVETFPDDGYLDMYAVMKALRQVRFSGSAVPDHVPELAGDKGIRKAGTAYCIASMRALLRRANEEVG
ncbi:MAG: mannonate dehydratase [Acidobacteria bacterium]|nr:mannonate dehydratase [Acidobacteriota bacterium]